MIIPELKTREVLGASPKSDRAIMLKFPRINRAKKVVVIMINSEVATKYLGFVFINFIQK